MNDFNLLRKMSRTPEVAGAKERQASGRSTVACHIYFNTVLPDSGPFVMQHDPVDLLLPFNGDNGFCGLPLTSYSPGHAIPSRSPPLPHNTHFTSSQDDEWGRQHASGFHCVGRVLLNLWRMLRGEIKLGSYTLESCAAAVLRQRVPHVTQHQLAAWFSGGEGC